MNQIVKDEELETALGTTIAQKIIRLLSIWETLSIRELIQKSQSSESQIHNTLQRLIACDIISKESRGIYSLKKTPFTDKLAEAYREQVKELINEKIYQIMTLLDNKEFEKSDEELQELENKYQPLLKKYFTHQLSGITHMILDYYENKK